MGNKLNPAFYDSLEMYQMTEKRSYKTILASVETHFIYINNHLSNLDKHLEKINTTNLQQEVKIARNKDRINLILRIGGGLLSLITAGAIAWVTHLQGVW